MGVTEDTVTDLIASYLREEGINAISQFSVSGRSGRDQPDFKIDQHGVFYGEAKWEDDRWKGLAEARDYGEEIAGTSGTFMIAYPDEIKQKGIQKGFTGNLEDSSLADYEYPVAFLRPDRKTDIKEIPFTQIPEWVRNNIEQKVEPSADTDQVVDILRQMARRLNDELQTAPEENLFRNVLGATTSDEEERQAARETAGFLLINQITFYKVLSHYFDEFEEIDAEDLDSPRELGDYFETVLDKDYTPVYQFRIADDLPDSSLPVVRSAVKAVNALRPENINHDVLGKVFHELIPVEARKKVAAYYTKNQAADILTSLTINDSETTVMDPACGSGTLLASSYLRKRELLNGDFDENHHRRFIEEDLTGIDVMPFAAHLSCIHLALQAPIYETDNVNIGIADSTTLNPGDTISALRGVLPESETQRDLNDFLGEGSPDFSDEEIKAGGLNLEGDVGHEIQLTKKDLVIMNPPFTRAEAVAQFSAEYKDKLETRFGRRQKYIHGKMSYYSYFFFLADKFLEMGGRIAAVVPATILNKESDLGVRQMLSREYDVEYIFAREDAPNYSEDTDFREVLIIAKKGQSEDSSTAFVAHDGLDIDIDGVSEAAANTEAGETTYGDNYRLQRIALDDLNINNLFAPFSVTNPELFDSWEHAVRDMSLTTLDALDVGRIRGIGSAGYGVMHVHPEASLNDPDAHKFGKRDVYVTVEERDDVIIAKHRHTGDKFEIPRDDVVPNLRRYSGREQTDLSAIPEYTILNDDWDGGDRYMSLTDEPVIPDKWADRVKSRIGHISLVRRVDLTAPGTHHLAYYSDKKRLYPDMMWVLPDADQQEAKLLTAWFDSTFGWLQSIFDRIETRGGWIEWHGYIIDKYRVPALSAFDDADDRGKIVNRFNDLKKEEAPSLVKQLALNADPNCLKSDELEEIDEAFEDLSKSIGNGFEPRKKLDKTILSSSSMPEEEYNDFLGKFYTDLLMEVVSLKLMMDT